MRKFYNGSKRVGEIGKDMKSGLDFNWWLKWNDATAGNSDSTSIKHYILCLQKGKHVGQKLLCILETTLILFVVHHGGTSESASPTQENDRDKKHQKYIYAEPSLNHSFLIFLVVFRLRIGGYFYLPWVKAIKGCKQAYPLCLINIQVYFVFVRGERGWARK